MYTTKMNFIFIIPDEMRAESLGCYGHSLGVLDKNIFILNLKK
jgi:arylsulfatase A-like enzyme